MSTSKSAICSARACGEPVHDVGPRTGTRLCRGHFDKEVQKATEQKDSLLKGLRALRDSADRAQLRAEQSALAAEVEEVSDMFDALQEALQQWRQRTLSRVQAVLDSVAGRLRDAAEAEQCEKDVAIACDAGDMKKVMELTASAELWLDEASERSEQFDEARSKLRERQSSVRRGLSSDVIVRSVGDVAAGVQQLHFIIDRHMTGVMWQCWLDEGEPRPTTQVCQSMVTIDNLGDNPYHLSCCSNTAGFGSDSSGRIVRAESKDSDITPLPQSCIFVSFDEKRADFLLVTSLDGAVRLKYRTKLSWSDWISGLHCDDERQLLFVAQLQAVTVADLSGEVKRVINADTLNQSALRVSAISGSMDKLYLFNKDLKEVIAVSKESNRLECTLNVSNLNAGQLDELALCGSKILLVDFDIGKVRKICGISGQLIHSYPVKEDEFFNTASYVAVDSRGLIFVTQFKAHIVSVLSSSGVTLQCLGVEGEDGDDEEKFRFPMGLAVVNADAGEFLVVADSGNCRLRVFLLH